MQNRNIRETIHSTADMMLTLEKSAPANHIQRSSDAYENYSSVTVSDKLNHINSKDSNQKGNGIYISNAQHKNENVACPETEERLFNKKTGFINNFHFSMTYMGKANERWNKFVDFVTAGQVGDEKIVPYSKLKEYLSVTYTEEEVLASQNAYGKEIYNILTCGWVPKENNTNELEPYIALDLFRLHSEDSDLAERIAKYAHLPVKNPVLTYDEESPVLSSLHRYK